MLFNGKGGQMGGYRLGWRAKKKKNDYMMQLCKHKKVHYTITADISWPAKHSQKTKSLHLNSALYSILQTHIFCCKILGMYVEALLRVSF